MASWRFNDNHLTSNLKVIVTWRFSEPFDYGTNENRWYYINIIEKNNR